VQAGSGYAHSCQMNLPGIVAGQNMALVINMVCQSTIIAEAFGYPFGMVVLVLQFCGSGKVHWYRAITTTIGAGGLT
jgi:hypothetical protein